MVRRSPGLCGAMQGSGDAEPLYKSPLPVVRCVPDLIVNLPSLSSQELDTEGDIGVERVQLPCGCESAMCSGDSGFSEFGDCETCEHCGLDCGGGCSEPQASDLLSVRSGPQLNRSCSNDSVTCSACNPKSNDNTRSSDSDFLVLKATHEKLLNCGFYYESLTSNEAREKLKKMPNGTFLVRDSSHKKYLYAISTQTERGPTSVRVEYCNGMFRLDCEQSAEKHIPSFVCLFKLINHYVKLSTDASVKNNCVWLESSGRRDTPVVLREPYYNGTIVHQTELRDARSPRTSQPIYQNTNNP